MCPGFHLFIPSKERGSNTKVMGTIRNTYEQEWIVMLLQRKACHTFYWSNPPHPIWCFFLCLYMWLFFTSYYRKCKPTYVFWWAVFFQSHMNSACKFWFSIRHSLIHFTQFKGLISVVFKFMHYLNRLKLYLPMNVSFMTCHLLDQTKEHILLCILCCILL